MILTHLIIFFFNLDEPAGGPFEAAWARGSNVLLTVGRPG
jgi:hypothetical protein